MWRCGLEVLKDYPELEEGKPRRGGRGVDEVSGRALEMTEHYTGLTDENRRAITAIEDGLVAG